MKVNPELIKFLQPYEDSIQKLTLDLRSFIIDLVPEVNELIWDNYNAVAMAYSKSKQLKDAFCHLAVYSRHVNFGFNRGSEIDIPSSIKLEGSGKLIRHLKVYNFDSFPKSVMEKLIWEAVVNAERINPSLIQINEKGLSIVMSISPKKKRPNK
ncbi:MAG: hypothetical protein AAGK97_05425 [Bacteroidota bacterium]